MRVRIFLVLLFCLYSGNALAFDGVTFGRGPVICRADDPAVTKASMPGCVFRTGPLQMGGTCSVLLETNSEVRAYGIAITFDFKEVRPRGESVVPLFAHTYDRVGCVAIVDTLTLVENCREYAKGSIRQCTACFKEAETEKCYYAHFAIDKDVIPKKNNRNVKKK